MEQLDIEYRFCAPGGESSNFVIAIDPATMQMVAEDPPSLPSWTELEFMRCPNCPLDPATTTHCPVAKNLVKLVEFSQDWMSYDLIDVTVITADRCFSKSTSAQDAFASLMGLLTAASACPRTDFFKPMARFHLPFSAADETAIRVVSMFLLGQYFRRKAGEPVDLDLDGINQAYSDIARVNLSMAQRLRAIAKTDASNNALIGLDCFAKLVPCLIEDDLREYAYLFTRGGAR